MPKYIKCPRCDINYILESEEFCEICKEELRGESHEEIIEDIEEDIICPKCGLHFLSEGETICETCLQKVADDKNAEGPEDEVDWVEDVDEEIETDLPEEEEELSLENLAEEEEAEVDLVDEKFDDVPFDEIDADLELNEDELDELDELDDEEDNGDEDKETEV